MTRKMKLNPCMEKQVKKGREKKVRGKIDRVPENEKTGVKDFVRTIGGNTADPEGERKKHAELWGQCFLRCILI